MFGTDELAVLMDLIGKEKKRFEGVAPTTSRPVTAQRTSMFFMPTDPVSYKRLCDMEQKVKDLLIPPES